MRAFASALLFLLLGVPAQGATAQAATKCLDCHYSLPFDKSRVTFNPETGEVCSRCHGGWHEGWNYHPITVTPTMKIPSDMPLTRNGAMSCITCHTYHVGHTTGGGLENFLRRPGGRILCYTCHRERLF